LNWVVGNYDSPTNIVISRSSDGAIGSSFYADHVAEHAESTQVTLLADAAGSFNSPNLATLFDTDILPNWPECAGKTNDNLVFEDFSIASANHNPNLTVSQHNAAEDEVQKDFSYLLGDTPDSFSLPQCIFNHYAGIESAVKNFHSYTAGGNVHIIFIIPDYSSYEVEILGFAVWSSKLITGEPVEDIN